MPIKEQRESIVALSTEYTKTAISNALDINRSYVHELLNKTNKESTMIERIREKYQNYKLRFDELTREFPRYGYRRIRALLRRRHGIRFSKKTVQKIMRAFNLSLPVKRKRIHRNRTTNPTATRPLEIWQTDMTKIWVKSVGWVYLFAFIDCYTREIVGYTLNLCASTRELLGALEAALRRCFPYGIPDGHQLTINSDNGCQFTARAFLAALKAMKFSFTRTGFNCPDDNPFIESFFARLKDEEVWINEYDTLQEAESSIKRWIAFYNTERIHSSLGYLTPEEYRDNYYQLNSAA